MEPVRTCVGCRTRAPRAALLRLVARHGQIVADDRAVLPGRGAWLHQREECLDKALRTRAIVRALRVSTPVDTQTLETRIRRNGEDDGHEVNGSK